MIYRRVAVTTEMRARLASWVREREREKGLYDAECPRCGAGVGEPCVGNVRDGSTLHAARVDEWLERTPGTVLHAIREAREKK
jgi:hypothetical protein